jgi:hypothetical protein
MVQRSSYPTMTDHPDLIEMRDRYERISATPPAVLTDGLVVLAGLWLAISPWVIHFNQTQPDVTVSNLIVGLAVALIGMGLTVAPQRMLRLSWATSLAGIWIVVSQWVIEQSSSTTSIVLNNVITGGVITLLGIAAAGMAMAASRGRMARR